MKIIDLHLPYSLLIRRETVTLIFLTFLCFSCGKEKVLHLPEIEHSEISEIKDVSHAYLFYDETQKDSVELNRKNLISTTNWLINVDKRLTLKQTIPHIKFLQDKKQNSSHKNEKAKNYFTCNDTNRKNLGFIEFTDVTYYDSSSDGNHSKILDVTFTEGTKSINFTENGDVFILNPNSTPFITKSDKNQLIKDLKQIDSSKGTLTLRFNNNLLFQDYITYKSALLKADFKHTEISNREFLDN